MGYSKNELSIKSQTEKKANPSNALKSKCTKFIITLYDMCSISTKIVQAILVIGDETSSCCCFNKWKCTQDINEISLCGHF